ncbi:MAG: lysine--tRNA ligase [Kiritimatiellia bacterium]
MSEPEQNEFREQRLANMKKLEELGYKPFGKAFERTRLAEVAAGYEEGKVVRLAGRLLQIRNMGKSAFCNLTDGTARFQIYIQKNEVGEKAYEAFQYLDVGDHIGAEGALFTTRTGEKTAKVKEWELLGKALLPLPEKFHGLRDTEQCYRQRYLDLVANPETRELFNRRIAIIREIRDYMNELGYLEVETPMLQPQAGGAAARPFVTRYNALATDMAMRIAPELYLKRLLVGGFDKVYELNRNFRNEGLDRTHNPEFTMLELYEAYGDVRRMKAIIEGLITRVALKVFGSLKVGDGEQAIDFTLPWREATYHDLVRERMGADWFELPLEEARAKARAAGLDVPGDWDALMVTHEVYEKLVEKSLQQPTFVTRLPAPLVPLAKLCEDDPSLVDVFELVIRGQEVAPAYTEMNDPLRQREAFSRQAGADVQKIDEDFLTALEHGMPPAGGMGVGIDRLVMILNGVEAIRDVVLFPQLRPRKDA